LQPADLATLIKQSLSLAEKYKKVDFIYAARDLLRVTQAKEVATVAFIIELAIQHSGTLGTLIVSSFEKLVKSPKSSNRTENITKFGSCDLLMLFLVSSIEVLKDTVRNASTIFNLVRYFILLLLS
jgi:hypothetical protein